MKKMRAPPDDPLRMKTHLMTHFTSTCASTPPDGSLRSIIRLRPLWDKPT